MYYLCVIGSVHNLFSNLRMVVLFSVGPVRYWASNRTVTTLTDLCKVTECFKLANMLMWLMLAGARLSLLRIQSSVHRSPQ